MGTITRSFANLITASGPSAVNVTTLDGVTVNANAGTASLPAITTTGDLNTGIFFPSADTIAFTEGGTEAMRINSSGLVGISTTTPTKTLDINGSVAYRSTLTGLGSGTNNYLFLNNLSYEYALANNGSNQFQLIDWNRVQPVFTVSTAGAVTFAGAVSKASGSFRIDHPLENKKDTHCLVHSFVESPQANNIYRGKLNLINGTATVNLDIVSGMTEGTFILLNRDIHCFTSNESGWTPIKGSISDNILTITAQDNTCIDTISWLVIGERQDKHMYDTDWTDENGKVIVEPLKEIVPEIISNEFKLNWGIDSLDSKNNNGYVTTIHWKVEATEGKLNTNINGTVSFKDGEPIIPYENLTKETILGWLFNNINKEEIESKLIKELETLKNPIVKSGLPWSN